MAEVLHMLNRSAGDSSPCPVLLIVDDDSQWRKLAREMIYQKLEGQRVVVMDCDSVSSALKILSETPVHAMVLDKNLGEESENPLHNGITAIPRFLTLQEHLQIVMATSSESFDDVVQAVLNGACTYVVKHKSVEYLVAAVARALRTGLGLFLAKIDIEQFDEESRGLEIPGNSPVTRQLKHRVTEAARSDAPVILLGESGTGKSTVAKMIHKLRSQYVGKRPSDRPFVRLNMAAITESLAESELFGHEHGAFTGSKKQKFGAFERARGGTLFLDEIGETPLTLQAKLLTALDDKKFFRVGGESEVSSEFRLICATNRNLEQLVAQGKFREDLYRRIVILEIKVPSVRERKDDMAEIVRAVLPKCCKDARVHADFEEIPKDLIEKLANDPPLGNIGGIEQTIARLLAHAPRDRKDRPLLKQWRSIPELNINRAHVFSLPDQPITMKELLKLDFSVVGEPGFPGLSKFVRQIEKKVYEDARRKIGSDYGSTSKIARALGISDAVVSRRLSVLGFNRTKAGVVTDGKVTTRSERRVGHEHSSKLP